MHGNAKSSSFSNAPPTKGIPLVMSKACWLVCGRVAFAKAQPTRCFMRADSDACDLVKRAVQLVKDLAPHILWGRPWWFKLGGRRWEKAVGGCMSLCVYACGEEKANPAPVGESAKPAPLGEGWWVGLGLQLHLGTAVESAAAFLDTKSGNVLRSRPFSVRRVGAVHCGVLPEQQWSRGFHGCEPLPMTQQTYWAEGVAMCHPKW